MAPLVSHLKELGALEAWAAPQGEAFEAGALFARTEGILPAPEANHAIAATIREARNPENVGKTILFNLCGHGHFDMTAWTSFNEGKLVDFEYPEAEITMALSGIPPVAES